MNVKTIQSAKEALKILSDAVFNDNGDMTVSVPLVSSEDCIKAYFASKALSTLTNTSGDDEAGLSERMKAAGMYSIEEMMEPKPLDRWMAHAAVKDMDTFEQWLMMRYREFVTMKAKYELGDTEKDELYEWVLAHSGAFSEVIANFRAAYARPQSAAVRDGWQPIETAPKDGSRILISHKYGLKIAWWGAAAYNRKTKSYNSGWTDGGNYGFVATHWMPLPAAPALHSTQEG